MTNRETLLAAYDELISMAKKLKGKDGKEVEVTVCHHDFSQKTIDKYGDEDHLPVDKWVTVSIYGCNNIADVFSIEKTIWEKYLVSFDTGYGRGVRDWELDWSMSVSESSNILKMANLYDHMGVIREKIRPYEERIANINNSLRACEDSLSYTEKQFISQKLYDNFTSDEKEKVQQYRKDVEESMKYDCIYAIKKHQFDPFVDEWNIVSIEEKDSKIKIGVSCKKNEGSISGLMTIYDMHYTDWINEEDILNI